MIVTDNDNYWNEYYKSKHEEIIKETLFADYILQNWVKNRKRLIEFGCGNGRDAIFFCKNGLEVVAVDSSAAAINELKSRGHKCLFLEDNFVNSANIYHMKYDICYSRFTIHAISLSDEIKLLENAYNSLEEKGLICIEVRSIKDSLFGKGKKIGRDEYIYNNHYRRFIRMNEILERLIKIGFHIRYAEENTDFAPFGEENPMIIRIVAEKENEDV